LGLVLGNEYGHFLLGGIVGGQGLVEFRPEFGLISVGHEHLARAAEKAGALDEEGKRNEGQRQAGAFLGFGSHGVPFEKESKNRQAVLKAN
jgi:hypothetical protein